MVVGAVLAGWVSDRVGRLATGRACALAYGAALAGMVAVPTGSAWVGVCYVLQAFFDAGVICVLRLTTLECFPSRFRSTGSAWTEILPTAATAGTALLLARVTAAGAGLPAVVLGVAVVVLLVVPLFGLLGETRGVDLETLSERAA
jgi:MFS family permease